MRRLIAIHELKKTTQINNNGTCILRTSRHKISFQLYRPVCISREENSTAPSTHHRHSRRAHLPGCHTTRRDGDWRGERKKKKHRTCNRQIQQRISQLAFAPSVYLSSNDGSLTRDRFNVWGSTERSRMAISPMSRGRATSSVEDAHAGGGGGGIVPLYT